MPQLSVSADPKRLIIADENDVRFRMLGRLAHHAFGPEAVILRAENEARLHAAMGRDDADIALVDDGFGGGGVLAVLECLRSAGAHVPVILLTHRPDSHANISAMRLSVDDYLVKDEITLPTFERAVRGTLRAFRLEAALAAAETQQSDILSALNHELRTPINGILGLSHLLVQERLDGTAAEYAEILMNTVATLHATLERLLGGTAFARAQVPDPTPAPPVAGTPGTGPDSGPDSGIASGTLHADLSAMSVLVVDDNALNRLIVQKCLVPTGAETVLVKSGVQALDLLKRRRFDCVLLDIQMPHMDGIETAARIRAMGAAMAQTSIIAFTASCQDHECRAYMRAGMNGILRKPFTPGQILDCLLDVARASSCRSTPPAVSRGRASSGHGGR